VLTQATVARLGAFLRGKKSDPHALTLQDLGHQRGHRHVAGIEGQINRFFTRKNGSRPRGY
jgi:hypothetical protein